MHIRILCVGKLKEDYFSAAEAEFLKRLRRFCTVELVEVADEHAPETLSAAQQRQVKAREGERLLSRIGEEERCAALVIGGKRYTSEGFSAHLGALRDGGVRTLTFLIGGSLGLSDAVLARADETLSLSDMTFPHRIARLVLLEQVYRAFKILSGEPYHK